MSPDCFTESTTIMTARVVFRAFIALKGWNSTQHFSGADNFLNEDCAEREPEMIMKRSRNQLRIIRSTHQVHFTKSFFEILVSACFTLFNILTVQRSHHAVQVNS